MLPSGRVDEIRRLLDVVRRELGADDARAEVGGRDPSDDEVWAPLAPGWRVVAVFDEPPDDPKSKRERLEILLGPFEDIARRVEMPIGGLGPAKQRVLDEELDVLAERAGARAAVVFDERSPVLWGSSSPRAGGWDLEAMELARKLAREASGAGLDPAAWLAEGAPEPSDLKAAGIDETLAQRWSHRFQRLHELSPHWRLPEWREALQIATAIGAAREECREGRAPERVSANEETWGVFARGFAQIYLLALVYDGPFSELHAEGPLVRALPHIESLVLALPPVDPPPKAAKVIALRPRR